MYGLTDELIESQRQVLELNRTLELQNEKLLAQGNQLEAVKRILKELDDEPYAKGEVAEYVQLGRNQVGDDIKAVMGLKP
jgi:hypothetical protein